MAAESWGDGRVAEQSGKPVGEVRFGEHEYLVARAQFGATADADELAVAHEECDPGVVSEFVEVADPAVIGG